MGPLVRLFIIKNTLSGIKINELNRFVSGDGVSHSGCVVSLWAGSN